MTGATIQLLAFLSAEFPVQLLIKRYGFRRILPVMMVAWSTVSWAQAFMVNRTGYYLTRALIGLFEGGFIPGTILFATYFYTSKELSVRLACFWSTLSMLIPCERRGAQADTTIQTLLAWFLRFWLLGFWRCAASVVRLVGFGCS